jgi:hypothetical protein
VSRQANLVPQMRLKKTEEPKIAKDPREKGECQRETKPLEPDCGKRCANQSRSGFIPGWLAQKREGYRRSGVKSTVMGEFAFLMRRAR